MPKFKVGDRVRVRSWESMLAEFGHSGPETIAVPCSFTEEMRPICGMIATIASLPHPGSRVIRLRGPQALSKWAISEGMLEHANNEAQLTADRKAKDERAKALRGLSAAGKRVVAMLQAGGADDFGRQRDNVIKLVAAITGDKPDAIKRAVAH